MGNAFDYLNSIPTFPWQIFTMTSKFRQFGKSGISQYSPSLTSDIERSYAIYAIKSNCYIYYIIDGFMALQKVQPSISHCKYIQRSFHHDFINNKDIVIKISGSMDYEWVTKLWDFCVDAVIDDASSLKDKSKFRTAIIVLTFRYIDYKLTMWEILWAICILYSTSGVISDENFAWK